MVQLDIILAVVGLLSCANAVFYYIFVAIRAKWSQHCHRSACKPILWSLVGVSLVLIVGTAAAFWVLCFPFWHPVSGFICVAKMNLLLEQWQGAAPQSHITQLDSCRHSSILPATASKLRLHPWNAQNSTALPSTRRLAAPRALESMARQCSRPGQHQMRERLALPELWKQLLAEPSGSLRRHPSQQQPHSS